MRFLRYLGRLLKEFGELSGENVNPEQKSWKDSVKKFFH